MASPVIVGLGASAGGLEALERFFGALDGSERVSFVVVMHLAPNRPSSIVEILQRYAALPVRKAEDRMRLEPRHVYVHPPDHYLALRDGRFRLEAPGENRVSQDSIDRCFASLAAAAREATIGIVLSGAGHDGRAGLATIREHGGLTLAQAPETAAYDAMPRHAIEKGMVDHVAEIAAMPRLIAARVQALEGSAPARRLVRDDDVRFFRDPAAFAELDAEIVRPRVSGAASGTSFRIWVPDCGRGEDAYSIAMLFLARMEEREAVSPENLSPENLSPETVSLKVFATDLDPAALDIARRGIYPAEHTERLPEDLARRFLVAREGHVRVGDLLRGVMRFSRHDLLVDPPFSRLDLLVRRELPPGAGDESRERLRSIYQFALRPGGVLFLLGDAAFESLEELEAVSTRHRIFRRRPESRVGARDVSRLVESSPLEGPPSAGEGRALEEASEASREQMRTLIEELHTVNAELQDKFQEVEAAHDDLENLIASTDVATIFLDLELRILRYTPATRRVLRLIQSDIGRPIDDLAPHTLSLELRRRASEVLRTLASVERLVETEDGSSYVERTRPYRTARGEIAGVVVTWADVTALRESEREKELLQEQLLQAQRMEVIGQLAGGVAHDFNNLITHIFLSLDRGLARDCPEPQRSAFEAIRDAADRARNLTQQLLAFSRRQRLERRSVDIDDLIGRLGTMLERVLGENFRLVLDLGADPARVKADPGQLEQVVSNLVINSRDAAPSGGEIRVETAVLPLDPTLAHRHPELEGDEVVRLSISDTGQGMSEEVRLRAFEPFFTTKPVGQGTGLGLSTVYGIVKQHVGAIELDSRPDEGTRVTVLLPRESETTERSEEPKNRRAPVGSETILLVEDETDMLKLLAERLRELGYVVLTAMDAESAEVIFEEVGESIDLVISDVILPGKSGAEAARVMREKRPNLPILLVSGYTYDVLAQHDHGTLEEVHFLTKPFTLQQLARAIRGALAPPGSLASRTGL